MILKMIRQSLLHMTLNFSSRSPSVRRVEDCPTRCSSHMLKFVYKMSESVNRKALRQVASNACKIMGRVRGAQTMDETGQWSRKCDMHVKYAWLFYTHVYTRATRTSRLYGASLLSGAVNFIARIRADS